MPAARPPNFFFLAQLLARRCLVLFCFAIACTSQAAPLGIVSDNHSSMLNIFNADRDVVTGMLDAHPGMAVGDCAIASDEKRGFTSSNNNEISFLNLVGGDQQEVSHHKQVAISNLVVDMALSPDDSLLVMAGGGALAPVAAPSMTALVSPTRALCWSRSTIA